MWHSGLPGSGKANMGVIEFTLVRKAEVNQLNKTIK